MKMLLQRVNNESFASKNYRIKGAICEKKQEKKWYNCEETLRWFRRLYETSDDIRKRITKICGKNS